MRPSLVFWALLTATLGAGFLLTAGNVYFGPLNQDEGWYLYSALEVSNGHWPFRDFAFTQPPVFPMVYSLFAPVLDSYGVSAGRGLTALFGTLGAVAFSIAAAGIVGVGTQKRWAFLAVLMVILLNSYHSYFTVIPKTYGLAVFWLGLFSLCFQKAWTSGNRFHLIAAGVFAALATGTRLSCVAALVAPVICFWIRDRVGFSRSAITFALSGGVSLILLLGPFLLWAPENTLFGLVGYHRLRESGDLGELMVLKIGFLSRLAQAYTLLFLLGAYGAVAVVRRSSKPDEEGCLDRGLLLCFGVIGLLMTLIHFTAPFPYDDYQVPAMPFFAMTLVPFVMWTLPQESPGVFREPLGYCIALFFFCTIFVVGSPIHQDWMVSGRDRIWWIVKDRPDLEHLQAAGKWLNERSEDSLLLTQDLYLAVDAGKDVPDGLEMGPFSYYPEWSNERAAAHHVVNTEMLERIIRTTPAEWAAFSGYGLSIASPQIEPTPPDHERRLRAALESRFEPVKTFSAFGQGYTDLVIYRRRLDH